MLDLDLDQKLDLMPQDFIGQRVAILGSSGNGKTNTLALILEHILPLLPFTIFDPHNEYWGLCEVYDMLRVGRGEGVQLEASADQAGQIAELAYTKRLSVLVEMLEMSEDERLDFVYRYCARLWELKSARQPYGVVLEEAQNFIPESKSLSPALKQIKQFALEGRKFGITVFLSSQRSAEVNKTVLGQCRVAFLHGVDILNDVQSYAGMLPFTLAETKRIALTLGTGECIVKVKRNGPAQFYHPVRMRQRKTLHVGDTPTFEAEQKAQLRAVDQSLLDEFKAALTAAVPPDDSAPVRQRAPKAAAVAIVPAPGVSLPQLQLRYLALYRSLLAAAVSQLDQMRQRQAQAVASLEKQLKMSRQRMIEPVGYDAPPDQMELLAGDGSLLSETVTETTRTVTRVNLTSRQLVLRQGAQRRIYHKVIEGAQRLGKTDRLILIEAFSDEQKVVDLRAIAPLYDLRYDTLRLRVPTLVDLGLVVKTGPGKVRSAITSFFQTRCPNLDTDELVEGLWKVIGQ